MDQQTEYSYKLFYLEFILVSPPSPAKQINHTDIC